MNLTFATLFSFILASLRKAPIRPPVVDFSVPWFLRQWSLRRSTKAFGMMKYSSPQIQILPPFPFLKKKKIP